MVRCYSCMRQVDKPDYYCPKCGKLMTHEVPGEHLLPGSVLDNRYMVGYAIGQGGFGITYIGFDKVLEARVAIKEYFPTGYVTRLNSDYTVSTGVSRGDNESIFQKGKENFLIEARNLAKFIGQPGIVEVKDFFESHNTAYIIMEYLDGITLKEYLKKNNRMTVQQTLELLKPAMEGLGAVHMQGIVHRDISPDNIMLLPNNKVKLLDFGAARDISRADNHSLSIMLKPGFAPEEQYRSRGEQGPWTDVYAMSATIYKCITGKVPDEASQRLFKDELVTPSECGISIDSNVEAALMKGLAVKNSDRYRSMQELINGLYYSTEANESHNAEEYDSRFAKAINGDGEISNNSTVVPNKAEKEKPVKSESKGKSILKIVVIALIIGLLDFGIYFLASRNSEKSDNKYDSAKPIEKVVDNDGNNMAGNQTEELPEETPALSSTEADKSITTEVPVVTEAPLVTEEPLVTETPMVTEEPSVTEEPVPTEELIEEPTPLPGIAIDKNSFPDTKFRNYVKNFDTDGDGALTEEELNKVEIIDVDYKETDKKKISSLQGIELFTNLKYLYCSDNELTELDIRKNTLLTILYCNGNNLSSLNVRKNTALINLECGSNKLEELVTSKNTKLEHLNCSENQIKELDLSNNVLLSVLFCNDNKLKQLDITKNTLLKQLNCCNNKISKLDIRKNKKLKKFVYDEDKVSVAGK